MPSKPSMQACLASELPELEIKRRHFGPGMPKEGIDPERPQWHERHRLAHLLKNPQAVNWGLSSQTSSSQKSDSGADEFSPQEQAVIQACNSPFGKIREGFFTAFGIRR